MSIGIADIFLLIAVGVYIFVIVDRICKACEQCSLNKSLGNAYSQINPNILNDVLKKKVENSKEI